jgi:hypothetical protein
MLENFTFVARAELEAEFLVDGVVPAYRWMLYPGHLSLQQSAF